MAWASEIEIERWSRSRRLQKAAGAAHWPRLAAGDYCRPVSRRGSSLPHIHGMARAPAIANTAVVLSCDLWPRASQSGQLSRLPTASATPSGARVLRKACRMRHHSAASQARHRSTTRTPRPPSISMPDGHRLICSPSGAPAHWLAPGAPRQRHLGPFNIMPGTLLTTYSRLTYSPPQSNILWQNCPTSPMTLSYNAIRQPSSPRPPRSQRHITVAAAALQSVQRPAAALCCTFRPSHVPRPSLLASPSASMQRLHRQSPASSSSPGSGAALHVSLRIKSCPDTST